MLIENQALRATGWKQLPWLVVFAVGLGNCGGDKKKNENDDCGGDPQLACPCSDASQTGCQETLLITCDGSTWVESPTGDCSDQTDAAGQPRLCGEVAAGVFNCVDPPPPDLVRGDLCLTDEVEPCAEAGDLCVPMFPETPTVRGIGACSSFCPPGEIGGPSDACLAGEVCLRNPSFVQNVGDLCTPETVATDCDVANGFECISLSTGESRCAQNSSFCGLPVPVWDGTGGLGNIPDAFVCGFGYNLCHVEGAVEPDPAESVCLPVLDPELPFGICVAPCRQDDGPDLDCGTALVCARPDPALALLFEPQADPAVPCTAETVGADCDPEFQECVTLGSSPDPQCARPEKVCLPAS